MVVTVEWDGPEPGIHTVSDLPLLKGRHLDRVTLHRNLTVEEFWCIRPTLIPYFEDQNPKWRFEGGPWREVSEFTREVVCG